MLPLTGIGLVLIALAGAIHVYIWLIESVLWTTRRTWRIFGIATAEEAEAARSWAFNQGYYNLFLAIGALGGAVAAFATGGGIWAIAIAVFSAACMVGAAIVLLTTSGSRLRPALVQGVLPLLGVAVLAVAAVSK
jgi:putative membrane protein